MRLIQIDDLREGMEIGKTVYSSNGQVLVKKGVILRSAMIKSIKRTNIQSVYIDDEFSREIKITDIIEEQLKIETVKKIKSFFTTSSLDMNRKGISKDLKEINELITQIIDQLISNRKMIVNLVDIKTFDDYTYQHSLNVAAIATFLGIALNFNRPQLINLTKGALFHDLGKIYISKDILNKPGKLTKEEYEEMKKHPLLGFEIARSKLNFPYEVLVAILHHHEKINGLGYPHGKKGDEIHINAQIVAICDVYDAITSKRIYHDALLPSEAIEYIMGSSGQHFHSKIVDVFLKKVAVYPLGICVELSNGLRGLVCENYEGFIMRPKIKVITKDKKENVYFNLKDKENSFVTVVKIIKDHYD